MTDPRFTKLADVLIGHSTRLQPGENILVETWDIPEAMVIAILERARRAGGHVHLACHNSRVQRALFQDASDEELGSIAGIALDRMKQMDAYLGIRGSENSSEMSGVPEERMKAYSRLYMKPVHLEERVKRTRWCVLRWPNPGMAQLAQTGTRDFEDFYFRVCTLDYARMQTAADALAERMARTDRVRLVGPGDTDLSFSIKDIGAVPCCGSHNIPDGECFSAPVRDSVNGVIHFNTPTIYNGVSFKNVRLEFENGRVVSASSDQNGDRLDSILDTDEGARYVGEFAVGFNPHILEPMKDILFDEKIAGSIHFTPGQAYEEADNGNRSDIHWDMVLIQRPEYGGGEMHFDDELVRKDGIFTADDLKPLNPEHLV
ncbi:MAG: aminopeptidase [Phycisphaerales bacterium]|nr:aminopeptidase [Phycisphaerales bacterium]